MAELIPLEYRISVARTRLITRWIAVASVVLLGAGIGFTYTYMWKRQQSEAYGKVQDDYQKSALMLKAARDVQSKRDALAKNMLHMQQLQNDTVLLALLQNISAGFSQDDCLEYIRVEAHPADRKPGEVKYSLRIRGITINDTSHSKLLDRLTDIGKKSSLPMKVNLGEKRLDKFGDGEVTFFDLTCEQPLAKAAAER